METNYTNHYACGDIVRFPTKYSVSNMAQIAHWGLAQKMGKIAALRMLGKDSQDSIIDSIPFFWTSVAGMNLRYTGRGFLHASLKVIDSIHCFNLLYYI
jgi:NADPH-dependent 2,4-dienoyl-CoA reductase/sulfur reductase-like enzyme